MCDSQLLLFQGSKYCIGPFYHSKYYPTLSVCALSSRPKVSWEHRPAMTKRQSSVSGCAHHVFYKWCFLLGSADAHAQVVEENVIELLIDKGQEMSNAVPG